VARAFSIFQDRSPRRFAVRNKRTVTSSGNRHVSAMRLTASVAKFAVTPAGLRERAEVVLRDKMQRSRSPAP